MANDALERAKSMVEILEGTYLDAFALLSPSGRIVSFNRAFFSLFPRKLARKLEGRDLNSCVTLSLSGDDLDPVGQCLERRASVRFDEVIGHIDGRDPLTLIVAATPLPGPKDSPAAILTVFRDVTDQVQIQTKYREMVNGKLGERDELEALLRTRTASLRAKNAELNALQRELTEVRKGLSLL